MNSESVQLAWALVAGRLTHISEFRHVPRGLRPTAMCEVCRFELILKLGPIRAHHYSHRSGSHCPLTAPETARHYNTKQLLATKLRSAAALSVVAKCAFSWAGTRCSSDLASVAAEGWDTVHVEAFIEPLRPDIVLLTNGAPTLAIEVRATHAVSEMKAASFSKLGISWIEVVAGTQCDEWVPGSALPAERREAKEVAKLCSRHSDSESSGFLARAAKQSATVRTSSFRADVGHHGDRWRFRVVDCYPTRGPRVRRVFWVYRSRLTPFTWRLHVVENATRPVIAVMRRVANPEESLVDLNQRLARYLRRSYERLHSSMHWSDSAIFPGNPATVFREDFMPAKYQRDSNGKWTPVTPGV